MGISFGGPVAVTYAALFPEASARCVAIATRVAGQEVAGEQAEQEMEQMLARHAGASWYPSARATWDDWTECVLAATDGREVDAMLPVERRGGVRRKRRPVRAPR
jgi:pimeloyl-ACP methyl ester carboxylesterase